MMNNTLIDNSDKLKLVTTLKEIISNPNCNHLQIATGYWDMPGMSLLYDELKVFFLERGGRLELLIGKEPQLRSYQLRDDLKEEEKPFPDFYIKRDFDKLNDTYRPIVELILNYANIDDESNSQIKIHVYGQEGETEQFLHAKCYIAYCEKQDGGINSAKGIIGSSNFTEKGLRGNAELNYLETDSVRVASESSIGDSKTHREWFAEMWKHSTPWTGKFIQEILLPSPIGKQIIADNPPTLDQPSEAITPYELYIKYLNTQFGEIIDANTSEVLKSYLPSNYHPLEYQLDAVKQGFSIMKRYGGFMLGDVVGLGKTVVGLMLIRMFLDQAESLSRTRKVLVVVPPSIRRGWENTLKDFDREHATKIEPCVDFITTGSIGNIVGDEIEVEDVDGGDGFESDLNKTQYGLIIVDESHNFRNRGTQKYDALDELIGISNPTPFVCLLSATPQNNAPQDLYNQITLFIRDTNNCNLPNVPGGKLDTLFNSMRKRFDEARNMPADTQQQRDAAAKIIAEVSKEIRDKVLSELVVRRTRTDIKKLYPEDSANLHFPTIKGPKGIEYKMDALLQKLFFDTIEAINPDGDSTSGIQFIRYAAITYFKENRNKKLYEKRNVTVDSITARLQKIMKIMLVKRLESSMMAFKSSLANLLRYTDVMIDMLEHDAVYICPDIDVNKVHLEADGNFDQFQKVMAQKMKGKRVNNRLFKTSDFKDSYLTDLKADRKIISKLLERWNANDYDPKFEKFKEKIPGLFDRSINNPSRVDTPKIVIFTEAIDTLKAIERALTNKGHKVLAITAANRDDMAQRIAANFDANLPADKRQDDYDAIVTTEVLAEGVNLHRANVILNYDAPWNATRLMQRIGRVNRIGSVEEFVHVFNFFPSDEGNQQIRLVEKAYAKLQSFHEMFGEDSKVFSDREEVRENDLNHEIDGDESPFGIYIRELKEYAEANPQRFNFLKSLAMEHLGGYFPTDDAAGSLYIFADQSEGLVSVSVETEPVEACKIISPLRTMEYLKCSPEARFSNTELNEASDEYKQALRAYQQHVTHVLGSKDSNKKVAEAQAYIRELRNSPEITPETKRLLAQVNSVVRNKNYFAIKALLRQRDSQTAGQKTLFGADYDINSWIQTTFAHLAKQAVERRGESSLALYVIK